MNEAKTAKRVRLDVVHAAVAAWQLVAAAIILVARRSPAVGEEVEHLAARAAGVLAAGLALLAVNGVVHLMLRQAWRRTSGGLGSMGLLLVADHAALLAVVIAVAFADPMSMVYLAGVGGAVEGVAATGVLCAAACAVTWWTVRQQRTAEYSELPVARSLWIVWAMHAVATIACAASIIGLHMSDWPLAN